MDRTTRSRLVAAGTLSLAGLVLVAACGGSGGGGGTAAPTSVADSTAFRTIPVTAAPTTAPPATTPAPADSAATAGGATGGQQDSASTAGQASGGTQGGAYTVVAGDYFYGIAQKVGVDAETLAAYNDMTIQSNLVPGMTLRIPPSVAGGGATAGGQTGGTSGGQTAGQTGGAATTPAASSGGGTYTAEPNDFWPQIASKLGVDLDALLKANNATLETTVYVGQKIKIPG